MADQGDQRDRRRPAPAGGGRFVRRASTVAALLVASSTSWSADPNPEGIEFFEKSIRPILVEHCLECHRLDKAEAGLRLDTSVGWLEGGDGGPVVVPGHPDQSRLLQALRHSGEEVDMPPDGKLDDAVIGRFETWIARGAPAPSSQNELEPDASSEPTNRPIPWSYQPVADPPLPEVAERNWPANEIDAWILHGLEAADRRPNPAAERSVLARRLAFDLVGLPPEPWERAEFLGDDSPAAYEEYVDRLLASPRFGERWGRHWLDIVRFAESLTLRGFVLREAWRYRDLVVGQFNDDRPYGDFLREQLAGDLLAANSLDERQRQLIAATFWTLGNSNLEDQNKKQLEMDIVDEQIDVMGKAILGQTIGCARCHDHKFDPIPTRDYYALAGILRNTELVEHANVSQWIEVPLPLPEDQARHFRSIEEKQKALQQTIEQVKKELAAISPSGSGSSKSIPSSQLAGIVVDDRQAKKVGAWSESTSAGPYVDAGYVHDENSDKGNKTVTFTPVLPKDGRYEVRLSYTPSSNRATAVPVTIFSAEGEKTVAVNMRAKPTIDGAFISLGEYRFEAAGQSFVLIANEGTDGHVIADAVVFRPLDEAFAAVPIQSEPTPADPTQDEANDAKRKVLDRKKRETERDLAALERQLADRPMVMSLRERKEITDCPVHRRGSLQNLGDVVPRGFLSLVPPGAGSLPRNESGRRELAEWVVSIENPLTHRVWVNRVWNWLFGRGLVRSTDNFGSTGDMPTHPELLDRLVQDFRESGESTKRIVRQMVESETYRQSSAKTNSVDPENLLWGRALQRRLDAESLRDAILVLAQSLDLQVGGTLIPSRLAADYNFESDSNRRSLYLPVFRNALPEMLATFDHPDPSLVVGNRDSSTVSQQALFLMNHPFPKQQADRAARNLLAEPGLSRDDRLRVVFLRAFGRTPTPAEVSWAAEIVGSPVTSPDQEAATWGDLLHLLMMAPEFRFVQ